MKSYKRFIGVFLCGCMASPLAWSDASRDYEYVEVGIFSQSFDYKEFNTSNDRLLREFGSLPGFQVVIGQSHSNFSSRFAFAFSQGVVTYDGQTQAGVPLETTTEAKITQAEFLVRPHTKKSIQNVVTTFDMGLGFREWVRDIQPTKTTNGLYEVYQWAYSKLALGFYWHLSPRISIGVAGEVLHPIKPTIDVNVVGYDKVRLNMNGLDTFRLSLPVQYRYASNGFWIIEPYWQMWEMGRSNTKPLYAGGVPTIYSATEPDNTTHLVGVSVSMRFAQ